MGSTLKRQALIVRLNPNLTLYSAEWPVTIGGNQNDVAYSAIQASDGNIVVCGKKTSTKYGGSANSNVWIFKLDLISGDTIPGTVHEYGGSGDDIGYDIVEDVTTGNYVIAGGTGNGANGDLNGYTINGLGEYWILAIDTGDFTITWDTIYHGDYTGGSLDDWAESIIIDHNGHYVVSGYCSSCQQDKVQMEAMLVKMENDGDFL